MDKDKMLDYFNDREATLFRDELGSNARYHELLQKKLAAEDAHRKMVGEAAWKQYLKLDEICNELESVRYQAMYLAGAADSIIDTAALSAVHSYTQGNPRLIDNLMTDALMIGSQLEKAVINADVIHDAVENQGLY